MADTDFSQSSNATFKSSGGSAVWTLTSLADGAGRASASYDLANLAFTASPAFPMQLGWNLDTKAGSAPTEGESARLYVAFSPDNTVWPGGLTTSDAAYSDVGDYPQIRLVSTCPLDADTSAHGFQNQGPIDVTGRYVQFILYNDTGVSLSATAADHELTIWGLAPTTA